MRPTSGTSFATPQVSATAALMLQLEPNLSPAEVKAALLLGATWLGPVPCTSRQYQNDDAADNCSYLREPSHIVTANNAASLQILNNVGFGLLDTSESLRYASQLPNYVVSDHLDTSTSQRAYTFDVDDVTKPVKVILTWFAHPHGGIPEQMSRTGGVTPANLDFVISHQGTEVAHADSLHQTTEFAVFQPESTGRHTVTVSGTGLGTINKPVQNYALASTLPLRESTSTANSRPLADPHTLTVQPGMPKTVRLSASDINGDAISFSVSRDPSQGVTSTEEFITKNISRVMYTPDADFAGTDTFEVTPYDGTEAGYGATITLRAESLPPGSSGGDVTSDGIRYWNTTRPGAAVDSRGQERFDFVPHAVSALHLGSNNAEGAEIEFVADGTTYTAAIPDSDKRLIRFASPLAISSATLSYDGVDEEAVADIADGKPADLRVFVGYVEPCAAPSGISGTAGSCPVQPDPDPPSPAPPGGNVLFHDDFESGMGKWTQTGYGQWHTTFPRIHGVPAINASEPGNTVAHADWCLTKCILELKSAINMSGYDSATLSLERFADSALDSGEYLAVELYDGSGWNPVSNWRGTTDAADGAWHSETYDLAGYLGVGNFNIRISTQQSDMFEDVEIDDVTIRAAGPGPDPPGDPDPAGDHAEFTAVLSADRSVITIRFERPTSHEFEASDFELSHGTVRSVHNTDSAIRTLGVSGVSPGAALTITYTGSLQRIGTGPGGEAAIAPDTSAQVSSQSDGARIEAVPGIARSGETVVLDGSASTGTGPLSYEWVQLRSGAPDVLIRNTDKAVAHFEVPYSSGRTKSVGFDFRLAVTDDVATRDAYIEVRANLTSGGEYVPPVPPDTVHFEETGIFAEQFYSLNEWHAHDEWRIRAAEDPLPADTNGRVAEIDECGDPAGCDLVLRDHFWLNPNYDEVGMLMYAWFGDEITDRDGIGTDIRMQFNTNTGPWHDVADARVVDSPHEKWFYVAGDLSEHRGKYVGLRVSPSLESDDSLIQIDDIRVVGRTADRAPPAFGPAPQNVTAEASSHAGTSVRYAVPNATDAVSGAADVTCWPPPGTVFDLGWSEVACTAVDASGNAATASFHVVVQDTTPPEVAAPQDLEIESPVLPAAVEDSRLGTATAADLADPAPGVSHDSPGSFPNGTTHVTWTATDASGNSATAVQRVTIVLTDATSIKAPPDITLEATAPLTPVPPALLGKANVTGAGLSPAISNDSPGEFPVGTTEVVWTVSGTSGGASDEQLVTIQDTTPPSVTAPPDIVIESNLTSTIIPESRLGTATAADLADPVPAITHDSPGAFPQGTTAVTWAATDASGNTGYAVQTVTVLDPGAPLSISAPPDIKIRTLTHITHVHEDDLGTPEVTGPDGLVISHDSPGAFHIGYTYVTWTVTDPMGRTANDTQRVYLRSSFTPLSDLTLREDFESGLGAWFENSRGNWEAAVPRNQPPGYGGASTVARSSDCDYICTMTMTYPIDLSSFGPVALVLDRYMSRNLDDPESLAVQMHDGSGWEHVAKWTASDGHADSQWHREVIPIGPEYLSSETSIRIIARSSNPDEAVMVDNISIIQGAVSGDGGLRVSEDPGNASLRLEWDPVPGYDTYLLQRNDFYGEYVPLMITKDTGVDLPLHVGDYDNWISLWLGAYNRSDPSSLVHVATANTTTGPAPSELYSDLPMHSAFDSGLDGWWYKERLYRGANLRCNDAASNPHGLSHSPDHGGSITAEDRRRCISVAMGATRGFTVPLEHHGYDMHVSFEYRATAAGTPRSDEHNNLVAYVLSRNGHVMNNGEFRYKGNVTDTGWVNGTLSMWHASYSNCPCSLYFFAHDIRSGGVERKIYLDNVHAELSPEVRGASDAPHSHNMLHEDEFLRMLLSHGSNVLVTQKVPYDSAVRLEWEPLGNATEYAVSIRPASDPGSVLSENVTGTQHMFVGLAPDTKYVVAVGVSGDGSTQSVLHAWTWPAGTVPFDAGLELDAYFDGPVVSVSWTDSNGIGDNRYTLERSVPGGPYEQVYSGAGTSHSDFITPDMFASNASYRVLEHVGAQVIYSDVAVVAIP